MKHIFLTGNIQVGKSTIINNVLDELRELNPGLRLGGFRTIAGLMDDTGWDSIHIINADGSEPVNEANCTFRRGWIDGKRVYESKRDVFETHGVNLLSEESLKGSSIILMDELGVREAQSEKFHTAVMNLISRVPDELRTPKGIPPVLGVVQIREGGFLDEIRNHQNVELIEVTPENRDNLTHEIVSYMCPCVI